MGVCMTVSSDDDAAGRLLNDLLRSTLPGVDDKPRLRTLEIRHAHMGYRPELSCDSVEFLITYGEGDQHR